jgi:hypothetical protein
LFKEKRSVIYPPPNYKEEVLEVAETFSNRLQSLQKKLSNPSIYLSGCPFDSSLKIAKGLMAVC